MSRDIRLMYGEKIAEVHPHSEGGTFKFEDKNACLNITSNYTPFFEEHLGDNGIHWLHEKSAYQTTHKLETVVDALNSFSPDADYWKPTAGNAKKALSILLSWAKLHPRAVWKVI